MPDPTVSSSERFCFTLREEIGLDMMLCSTHLLRLLMTGMFSLVGTR